MNNNELHRTAIENIFLKKMSISDRLDILKEENELDAIIPEEMKMSNIFDDNDSEFEYMDTSNIDGFSSIF